ncbi:MAG: SMI1/KNR4 family protein [Clostridia bacterium]|nr:SMI1/KNR4 family protein [Clostridia bacterium]
MTDIKKILRTLPAFCSLTGVHAEQIDNAENALGLHFADDYREYLLAFAIASSDGHEFTGICNSKRLNVIDVTIAAKNSNPSIPRDWYVLEDANMDGIIIWQNKTGSIFQTQPNRETVKISDSICEYLGL